MQLLVSWAIVVISTLYALWASRGTYDCAEGEDCASGEGDWWIPGDSSAIAALGEFVFFLTVGASFLISFDSYVNAKARSRPFINRAALVLNPNGAGIRLLTLFMLAAGALAAAAVVRRRTGIDHLGVPHARCAVRTRRVAPKRR
mgnify:CR=1 FL=1